MDSMEQKYFPQQNDCHQLDQRTTISSDSLSLYSFGGLFIITAVASVSSLVIYLFRFLQSHWNTVHIEHQETSSVWSKFGELVKRFDNLSPYSEPRPVQDVNTTTTSLSSEDLAGAENTSSCSSDGEDDIVVDNTQTSSN